MKESKMFLQAARKIQQKKKKKMQDAEKEVARAQSHSWPIVSSGFPCEPSLLLVPVRIKKLISLNHFISPSKTLTMLQLLTFLVEKLSLLSNFKLFESSWSDCEDRDQDRDRYAQRGPHPSLRRGDLLEVPRTLFTHCGIYVGDNKVAHLIPDILPVLTNDQQLISSVITHKRLILGCVYRCATVRLDTLEDFAYGAKIVINNMDKMMKSQALPSEDVAKRAEKLLGAIPYSLLWYNCEHFVTHCRYGSAASRQTEKVYIYSPPHFVVNECRITCLSKSVVIDIIKL